MDPAKFYGFLRFMATSDNSTCLNTVRDICICLWLLPMAGKFLKSKINKSHYYEIAIQGTNKKI